MSTHNMYTNTQEQQPQQNVNAIPAAMVAEPGNATHGTGPPNAAVLLVAACVQPAAPNFGPYEAGGGPPGRWSQVQRLGDFVNGLARKMESWAFEIGLWQRTTETRLTATETEVKQISQDITSMKSTIDSEIQSVKTVVETEFRRNRRTWKIRPTYYPTSHRKPYLP